VKVIDPHEAVNFMLKNSGALAEAKAARTYLEQFIKSKKAIIMKAHPGLPANAQEREALADSEYIELLGGLREAVEKEENLRWHMEAAKIRVDIWRSQEASNRAIDRAAQ
jgi:hypothetical protein